MLLGNTVRTQFRAGVLEGFVDQFQDFHSLVTDRDFQAAIRNIGRGIGLMQLLGGALLLLVTAAAYLYPRMRLVEDELPDAIPDAPAPQIA